MWPGGGTQGAGHGPRWPRRRGGQPELTGTESTGECRRMTSPDTAERGGHWILRPQLWKADDEPSTSGRSQRALHLLASSYSPSFCLCLTNSYSFFRIWLHLNPGNFPYCFHPKGHWFSSGLCHTRQVPWTWRNARLYTFGVLLGANQRPSHFTAQLLPVGGNVGMPAEENEGARVITEPRPSLSSGEPHQTGIKGIRDDILEVVKPRGHSERTNIGDIGSQKRDMWHLCKESL